MCECRHSILFHVLGFLEDDRHCIFPGCGCPAYAPEVTS
jgi:hypothetical protein